MNVRSSEMLSNPQRCGQILYTWAEEPQVTEAVCLFAGAGFRKGEAVLLVMAQAHHEPILQGLRNEGFDLEAVTASGQLACMETEGLLSSFMFDGVIDEHLFKTKIRAMIDHARVDDPDRPVRVFGEMVNFIWQSRQSATERLEELWNDVIREYSVPLLCAYGLAGSKLGTFPPSLTACHSHAVA
jgi:MEDS: MEthanogen/methylotroph, DcmR Sensory domain